MRMDFGSSGFAEIAPPVMEPVEQIMRMFEAHYEDQMGWDARPVFFCLIKMESGIGAISLHLPEVLYQEPGTYLLEFAQYINEGGPLSVAGHELLKSQVPPFTKFYGVGALNEGWSVVDLSSTEVQAIADGQAVPPSQRPDRVETRMVHVVTTDGRIAGLIRERGGTPVFSEFGPSINEDGALAKSALTGRVPNALRLLCDAMERICG